MRPSTHLLTFGLLMLLTSISQAELLQNSEDPAGRQAPVDRQADRQADLPVDGPVDQDGEDAPIADTPDIDTDIDIDIEVVFQGNSEISTSRLRKSIAEELESFATHRRKAFADDAAFELASLYLASGYPDAVVDFQVGPESESPQQLLFLIDEGPRTVVTDLSFIGNHSYEGKSLQSFFESTRRSSLGARGHFVLHRIKSEIGSLENFYRSSGFLEVSVEPAKVQFSDDRREASIEITLQEGPRFLLREIRIPSSAEVPASELEEIRASFLHKPYNSRFPYEIRGLLADSLGHRGFPDAHLEVEVLRSTPEASTQVANSPDASTPETSTPEASTPEASPQEQPSQAAVPQGEIRLVFEVDPGQQVFLSEIQIQGAKKSHEGFIRSCLDLEAGHRFDNQRVREGFRCLYRTGLFSRVDIRLAEGEGDRRPLQVTVEELPTREIFMEPGFGAYEGLRLKLGLKQKNLFGRGSELRGDTTVAERALRAKLTYSDPWSLVEGITTDISASANERELDGFTSTKYGAGISLRKEWSSDLTATLGYQFRRSESRQVIDPESVQVSQEDVDISSLKLTGRYDDRDNLFAPHSGWLAELHLEYASESLGSELEFLRSRLTVSAFHPLGKTTTLGLSLRGGVIVPIGNDTAIPLQERYYAGGENSVRSFKENALLPRDSNGAPVVDDQGNSQGGEAFTTLSLELRQALLGNLHGALFADAGHLSADASDLFEFTEVRTAVGLGLRYLLPIGPIRLDGAWNPDRDTDEEAFVWHFSVGMAF
ncbi:MAG: BamA/TamA family outer membrane protein [Deltaproteobacteria bacterium]|nr:BamA/TamA family outer membrane protein [Deltaproteobacteria bacterium]